MTEKKDPNVEKRLKSIFQAAPVGIGVVADRIIIDANDRLGEMTGYSRDELIGQNAGIFYLTDDDYNYVGVEKYKQISEKGTGSVETRWRRKDGTVIDVLLSSTPIDPSNLSAGITFTALDITKFRLAETELKESERRHRLIVDKINDTIWTADLSLRTTYVSPSIEKLLGYTPEERMSQNPVNQMTSESFARVTEFLALELEREKEKGVDPDRTVKIDIEYIHKNGSIVWIENIIGAIRDEKGVIIGIHGISRDITERKRTEEALRESEEKFRLTFQSSPDSVNINRLEDGLYVDINEGFTKLTGFTREDAIGKTSFEINIWHDLADRQRLVKQLKEKGACENLEAVFRRKDGRLGIGLMSARVIILKGAPHIISITRDITERKRAEETLRESEEKHRILFEYSAHGILMADIETKKFGFANPAICRMFGYSEEELTGLGLADIHPADSLEIVEAEFEALALGRKQAARSIPCLRKNKTIFYSDIVATPVKIEGRKYSLGFFQDITERKKAEEELYYERQRFQNLIQNAPFGMLMADKNDRFIYINPKFSEIFGYELKDIPDGRKWFELAYPDAEYRKEVISAWIDDLKSYGTGEKRPRIYEVTCKGGARKIIHFIPVRLQTGEHLISCEDITERITLENQLRHSQKMESVGRLAGGVAHDFNNMLQAIMGYAELALLKIRMGSPADSYLIQIKQAAQRSADLVRQLLAFARKQTVSPRVLDLNETVPSILKILKQLIGENIKLVWKPDEKIWPVKMDPVQIDQILANLIVNARDSIQDSGVISIQTQSAAVDEIYCRIKPGLIPGKYSLLMVSDTGSGMDKETLSHIFEPFYTTKDIGEGTGLGLSTVYGIVKQNGGFIDVHSEPDYGTTFKIYLPACFEEAGEETYVSDKTISGGAETVLVVEDEQMLLEFVCNILKEHGYDVLKAMTPADALSLIRGHEKPVHLLITDVIMPGMNGRDLSDAVMKLHPEAKTLFISGHPADVIARHGVLDQGTSFLQKPFLVTTLTEKVREVLEG
jgi:PAS domain S-box-containing protein